MKISRFGICQRRVGNLEKYGAIATRGVSNFKKEAHIDNLLQAGLSKPVSRQPSRISPLFTT
jgi:diketogulonate reductase-like aldo/keto reductase